MVPNPTNATTNEDEANEITSLLPSSKLQRMPDLITLPNALVNASINEKLKNIHPSEQRLEIATELPYGKNFEKTQKEKKEQD